MDTGQWNRGFDPSANLAQLSEITLRLTRIALYRKIQQAEAQLNSMGVKNDLSTVFKNVSKNMLEQGFKKPLMSRTRISTTSNSTF